MFLGTPFRGAEGLTPMQLLDAARTQYSEDQIQPEGLTVLKPGNEFLQDLVDQFSQMWTPTDSAQVACFFELKASNVGKIVGNKDRHVCDY